MMGKTHFLFGLIVGIMSISLLNPSNPYIFLFVVALFSIIPDIDSKNSILGKRTKIFAWLMNHRGLFHSLIMLAAFSVAGFVLFGQEIGLAVFLGYASHLFLDLLTKQGIYPIYPFHHFHIRGFIKTNRITEHVIMFFMFAVLIFILLINKNIFI